MIKLGIHTKGGTAYRSEIDGYIWQVFDNYAISPDGKQTKKFKSLPELFKAISNGNAFPKKAKDEE